MKKFFKYFVVSMAVALAAFCFAACGKNEFDGKGAGEIALTLAADYDGVRVDCPDGEVSGSGKSYVIKVKTRKRTDVIVSCEGYHTQTVSVYTKDFADGVAQKNVTLEKRYNTLTLTVSGVTDISGVTVKSDKENTVRETFVNGKKLSVVFNEFSESGEIDKLSVECNGYYPYKFGVNASDFFDYSASAKVSLLRTDSNDASVTFINDLSGSRYSFYIYKFDGLDDGSEYMDVSGSSTTILDKTENYVLSYNTGNGSRYYPIASEDFENSPYKVIRLSELKGIRSEVNYNYSERPSVTVTVSPEIRSELDPDGNNDIWNIMQHVVVLGKNGKECSIRTYGGERSFYIDGVKKGDEVRVVAANGKEFIADYNVTLESALTVEKKVENDSVLKIRFSDPYGNQLNANEDLVQLFNGSSGFEHFVSGGGEFVNAAGIDNIAAVSADNKEIVLDWEKLMSAQSLQGGNYTDKFGGSLYLRLGGETVYFNGYNNELYKQEYYYIIVRETYDILIDIKDTSGDPITGRRVYDQVLHSYIEYDALKGGYLLKFEDGNDLYVSFDSQEDDPQNISYRSVNIAAFKDFLEYDTAGGYYKLTVTVYREKQFAIEITGSELPSEVTDFSFSIGDEWVWATNKQDPDSPGGSGWLANNISEKCIGKTFTVNIPDRYDDYVRYEATATFTQEVFDRGVITLNFKRIDMRRPDTQNQ